jgi:hypothetical protein
VATQGSVTLDFGASGATDVALAVTGQTGIVAGSLVDAWLMPAATLDHSVDEHRVEELEVMAGNIVAGTGFTIYGRTLGKFKIYGRWNVAWVWN